MSLPRYRSTSHVTGARCDPSQTFLLFVRIISIVLLHLNLASCHQSPPLEQIALPSDLEQLDPAIGQQLGKAFEDLEAALETGQEAPIADAYGSFGMLLDLYRLTGAEAAYRNAQMLSPDNPKWHYFHAVRADRTGDVEIARNGLSRALELSPGLDAATVRLAELELELGRTQEATRHFEVVLQRSPNLPRALVGAARIDLANGQARRALERLSAALEAQPEASQIHYALALAHRQLGAEDAARHHLAKVPADQHEEVPLRLEDPWLEARRALDRSARAKARRALHAWRRGDLRTAAGGFAAAAEQAPGNLEYRVNHGLVLEALGDTDGARHRYHAALGVDPDSVKAHLALGALELRRGRLARAEPHLERAASSDPDSVGARLQLGKLRQNQGRLAEATAEYAAAREIGGADAEARFWHAIALALSGRAEHAVDALEEDLHELPGDRRLRMLLARLLAAGPASRRDVKRAAQLARPSAEAPDLLAAETLAMVAAELGQFKAAVAWQTAALATAPRHPRTLAQRVRRRLVLYREGHRCGEPWGAQEIPVATMVRRPANAWP